MADRILKVLDVRRSAYNYHEIVLTLECLAEGSNRIRYQRTITLTEALAEYDPLELMIKLQNYRDNLSHTLRLTETLISCLREAK